MSKYWSLSNLFLISFLLLAGLSVNFFSYPFLKLLVWVAIALLISLVNKRAIFLFLAIAGLVESILALFQFYRQAAPANWRGDVFNTELARIFVDPGLLLRAYGTFPHPNILAAFLILSIIAIFYFTLKSFSEKHWLRFFWIIAIFISFLGLTLTFSRVGWIIAGMASLAFLLLAYNFGFDKKNLFYLLAVMLISIAALLVIFHWAIFPRITTLTPDNFTVQERLGDYHLAWEKIKEKPWLGSGLTLKMGERPIHNIYLLIATEIGGLGLAVFLFFVGSFYFRGFNNWNKSVALIMLSSLLLYGLFDHFLWTLRPGMGMFWLVIGLLI